MCHMAQFASDQWHMVHFTPAQLYFALYLLLRLRYGLIEDCLLQLYMSIN